MVVCFLTNRQGCDKICCKVGSDLSMEVKICVVCCTDSGILVPTSLFIHLLFSLFLSVHFLFSPSTLFSCTSFIPLHDSGFPLLGYLKQCVKQGHDNLIANTLSHIVQCFAICHMWDTPFYLGLFFKAYTLA